MDKLFVPDNSWLLCDKGSCETRLKVTHNNKTTVYGENLASEADMVPGENVMPFGKCSIDNKPCSFDPLYWDKTREKYKVNGYKLLVDSAYLICKKGGKIAVSLTMPSSASVGAGMGLTNAARGLKGAAALAPEVRIPAETLAGYNTTLKGNFGEIRSVQELMAKGYSITSSSHATTVQGGGHKGLDYSAKGGSVDVIGDSKYSTTGKKPNMDRTKGSGRQMSNEWLQNPVNPNQSGAPSRVEAAMSADDAARVLGKIEDGDTQSLRRVANSVDPQGRVSWYEVDNAGSVGNAIELPPANVMKGSSKAANFINDVGKSIQSTKSISTINQSIIKNADHIAMVGKNLGRGALVVGIVMDGIAIYDGFEADGGKVGVNTTAAVGSMAGGIAGGLAGAEMGAAIGAIGGPVGVLVGGVVGGIIGGVIGSGAGAKIGAFFGSFF